MSGIQALGVIVTACAGQLAINLGRLYIPRYRRPIVVRRSEGHRIGGFAQDDLGALLGPLQALIHHHGPTIRELTIEQEANRTAVRVCLIYPASLTPGVVAATFLRSLAKDKSHTNIVAVFGPSAHVGEGLNDGSYLAHAPRLATANESATGVLAIDTDRA